MVAAGSTGGASPDDLAAASSAQIAADTAAANATMAAKDKASHTLNSNGTSTWILNLGAETPDHKVSFLEMLPAKVNIKSGDRVVWRVQGRNEPHTVTFPKDLHAGTVPLCEGPNGDTPATPTKNPPTGPNDFACPGGGPPDETEIAPGNGVSTITSTKTVSDSGLLLAAVSVQAYGVRPTGALHTWRVWFTGAKKGTYTYVCQIHDGMKGTIVVG